MDQKQQHENNVSMAKKIQRLSRKLELLAQELDKEREKNRALLENMAQVRISMNKGFQ